MSMIGEEKQEEMEIRENMIKLKDQPGCPTLYSQASKIKAQGK